MKFLRGKLTFANVISVTTKLHATRRESGSRGLIVQSMVNRSVERIGRL